NLGAVDVLAAGDDHVLLAVDDPDIALVVLADQVAGVEPTAFERLGGGLRVVPVAGHQRRRPVDDLADLADGYIGHVLVDDSRGPPTTACHCAGTRNIVVTRSASSTSSKCAGSNAPSG